MHPKQICADVQSMGAKLVLDGNDLFIEHPEKVAPEIIDFIKSYKSRIISYLKGNYPDQDHAVKQTIDKIINFYIGINQDMNVKINDWLNHDEDAARMIMDLTIKLADNGWSNVRDSIANFENEETDKLSQEIFNRAMTYFKKGA